jgi:hypothetical protein
MEEQLKTCCGKFPRYKYTNDGRAYLVCLKCGRESKPRVNNILAGEQWNQEME